jgi:hypothetical protein
MWFSCRHQFSWPRRSSNGDYYQVCLQCGVRYRYDWNAMRRTSRWEHEVKPVEIGVARNSVRKRGVAGPQPVPAEVAKVSRWHPRERRLRFEVPVLYRPAEASEWLHGQTENISRSGLLFQAKAELSPGTPLELILEMPAELSGAAGAKVICQAKVARVASSGKGEARLAAIIVDYQFLPKGQVSGL